MSISVFVSSKQEELATERGIFEHVIQEAGMEPVLAGTWSPRSSSARDTYSGKVLECPIYIGIFYREYSSATVEEYRLAKKHPHREVLCYVRKTCEAEREPRMQSLVKQISRSHLCYSYRSAHDLLPIVRGHLQAAVGRMIQLLMRLKSAKKRQSRSLGSPMNDRNQDFLQALGFLGGEFESAVADAIVEEARVVLDRLGRQSSGSQ